jgi:hypothetical protein
LHTKRELALRVHLVGFNTPMRSIPLRRLLSPIPRERGKEGFTRRRWILPRSMSKVSRAVKEEEAKERGMTTVVARAILPLSLCTVTDARKLILVSRGPNASCLLVDTVH